MTTCLFKVLREAKALLFPRKFGHPEQQWVHTARDLALQVITWSGHGPCFISHNAYPTANSFGEPTSVHLARLFVDFDDDRKTENAQNDAISLVDLLEEHNMDYEVQYSAGKGFHVYPFLNDRTVPIDQDIRLKYYHISRFMTQRYRTADPACKDIPRLCRMPITPHSEGRWCIPLTLDDLKSLTMPQIRALSRRPQAAGRRWLNWRKDRAWDFSTREPSIDGFMRTLDIMETYESEKDRIIITQFDRATHKPIHVEGWMKWFSQVVWRPCIQQDLFSSNPRHFTRFCAATQLCSCLESLKDVIETWDIMAEKCGHVDRFRTAKAGGKRIAHQQLEHIWGKVDANGSGYTHPNCSTIKREGLCVGKACHHFIDGG